MESSKGIANIGIKNRIRQFLILTAAIITGIIITQSVQAQGYHKAKAHHYKHKYRNQIKLNDRACNILAKKRVQEPHQPSFAFSRHASKPKPMAEIDTPAQSNRKKQNKVSNERIVASN